MDAHGRKTWFARLAGQGILIKGKESKDEESREGTGAVILDIASAVP